MLAYPATAPLTLVASASDLCRAMRAEALPARAIDASGLDRVLRHDTAHGLLEVQAGAPWAALPGLADAVFPTATVGEGLALNCAGPDGRPMVAHLRALTLVTPDGELRRASRECSPEIFRVAVGGLGVFGPFYSLTFDLASLASAAAAPVAGVRLAPDGVEADAPGWLVEVLVPAQACDAFVAAARAALEERRFVPTHLEARPTLSESDTLLRWARADFVALRVGFRPRGTVGGCVAAVQLRARLLELAVAAGGSCPPADLPLLTRAQAAACYPMLGAFLAEKRRLDPAERLAPRWYRDVSRLWRGEACRPRWAN